MIFENNRTLEEPIKSFGTSTLHDAQVLMNGEHVLTPRMVSSLLNVSVLLESEYTSTHEVAVESSPILNAILIAVSAVVIAAVAGVSLLYVYEIGPFNKPIATTSASTM